MHCLKYSLKFRSLTNLIFYHAYANFPHLGKKFCTKKRLIGLVLWVLWYSMGQTITFQKAKKRHI